MIHSPKYRYDCKNCKFSWCCGIGCDCSLDKNKFGNPPKEIQIQHARELIRINPTSTLEECIIEEFGRSY